VAQQIKDLQGLFLIDEVDALRKTEDKHKLAELIKHLSDEDSRLKILLVGIADTADYLTAGHPSVSRCLKETKLNRMTDAELREIIEQGQERAGLTFSKTAIDKIVRVSSGYPHFTHLLALKASEDAIAEGRQDINVAQVLKATSRAVGDAEGSLKKSYDDAIRSASSDRYRRILVAAAQISDEGFSAKQLRDSYRLVWGESVSQGTLNNYFKRLVADDTSCVLQRLAKGVYRFTDPRMRSFIQIANLAETDGKGPT
jgi:Cdc6-like AAA superfamily ATPase